MRPKTHLLTITPLLKQPFFTSERARAIGVSSAALSHYVKTGQLKRIRRGVYQGADYHNAAAFQWEDLIQAVYSIPNGIVCLISALAVYDLTEEIPRQYWIGIRHGSSVKLEGVFIPIFDRERTIVDAFRLLARETAIKALKVASTKSGKNRLDLIKLEAYAKKLRFDITPYLLSVTT